MSQEDLTALHNCISYAAEQLRVQYIGSHADVYLRRELDLAHKQCAYMGQSIYAAWAELPEGTPLKEVYRDDVWHPEQQPELSGD